MPLFCSSCGKVVNGKYCVHCGAAVEEAETIGRAKDETPLSFAAFYKQKSNNRMMQYQKRKKWSKRERCGPYPCIIVTTSKGSIDTRTWFQIDSNCYISWDYINLKKAIFDKLKWYSGTVKKLKLSDVKLVYKLQAEEKEDRLKTLKRGKM